MLTSFFTNCQEYTHPSNALNWQLWVPAIISLVSAMLVFIMTHKTQKHITDRKNRQEHLLNDKKHLKDILSSLIDKIDVENPITNNIGNIWQIKQKIHFFSDTSNPYTKSLLNDLHNFTVSYEEMKIASNTDEVNRIENIKFMDIIETRKDFNVKNDVLIKTVNKYFDYYLSGK